MVFSGQEKCCNMW